MGASLELFRVLLAKVREALHLGLADGQEVVRDPELVYQLFTFWL